MFPFNCEWREAIFIKDAANWTASKAPQLIADVEEMIEALRFYADKKNHHETWEDGGCGCCTHTYEAAVTKDEGQRARAILERMGIREG